MRVFIAATSVSMLLLACTTADELTNGRGRGSRENNINGDGTTPGSDPTQPGTCKVGAPHMGFGATDFVADRVVGAIGVDRRRVKPFAALRTDFQRVLGEVPSGMDGAAAAYGDPPARWYAEPAAGAVSLNTTYSLAFTGCYDSFSGAEYQQAPTNDTATTQCQQLQAKFWQRTPTPDEIQACRDFVVGLTTEPVARRRWAHACASILTAAGFTTY